MISRYSVNDIIKIWSDENKYQIWLDVEIAICEAWAQLGVIPKKDLEAIQEKTIVNLQRMNELELETKHDVVAFTRMISESLEHESKWIHLGITSTDVVDTAQNIMIKQSNEIVYQAIIDLQTTLEKLAIENKDLLIMGRTHGMHGEPTSLGLKFALWFDELSNQLQRLTLARKEIEVPKVSGSMGNYANLEIAIEDYIENKFGLHPTNISTQVVQRDRHANLISVFANIASTLEKISTEIRLLQQSEIGEVNEGFGIGQKGSSSMPHKKNPISSENIAGLARYIRSFVNMTFENNNLWHERDISHSSNERLMFPDVYNVLVYIIRRANDTLANLYICPEKIMLHIQEANNIFYSQRVLTYLIMNTNNITREEIYDFVQTASMTCLKNKTDFKIELINAGIEKYLDLKDLNSLFNLEFFNHNTNLIYQKVFKKR